MNVASILTMLMATATKLEEQRYLKMTLCPASGCSSTNPECKSYITPLSMCYNGQIMFPTDESWGDYDVLDELVMGDEIGNKGHILHRSFYETTDGSCGSEPSDDFRLPLGQCVGPFGDPLPWGSFEIVLDNEMSVS